MRMHGPHQSDPEKLRRISLCSDRAEVFALSKSVSQIVVESIKPLNIVIHKTRIFYFWPKIKPLISEACCAIGRLTKNYYLLIDKTILMLNRLLKKCPGFVQLLSVRLL